MKTKEEIVANWLPRYTGTPLDEFGDYILITNFSDYVTRFAKRFDVPVRGIGHPMQTASNKQGLTIVNYGMGSANAATCMDLLSAVSPRGVLFLGKCGELKSLQKSDTLFFLLLRFEVKVPQMIIYLN